jgi:hypothetical protein
MVCNGLQWFAMVCNSLQSFAIVYNVARVPGMHVPIVGIVMLAHPTARSAQALQNGPQAHLSSPWPTIRRPKVRITTVIWRAFPSDPCNFYSGAPQGRCGPPIFSLFELFFDPLADQMATQNENYTCRLECPPTNEPGQISSKAPTQKFNTTGCSQSRAILGDFSASTVLAISNTTSWKHYPAGAHRLPPKKKDILYFQGPWIPGPLRNSRIFSSTESSRFWQ